jgi:putative methyltransferase (TIGR04325 family)
VATFRHIFHQLSEVPDLASPWETPQWVSHINRYAEKLTHVTFADKARELARSVRYGNGLPRTMTPLKGLIRQNGRGPILDIGGGFGDNFIVLRKYLGDTPYTVVDGAESRRLGRQILGDRVAFQADMPVEGKYGLSIVIGTLQYILDSSSFISALSKLSSEAVYVSRSPLRKNGDDFYSIQEITPGYEMDSAGESAVLIRSVENLVKDFSRAGFELADSTEIMSYRDQMMSLPEEYRDCAYFNMTFKRRT